MDVIGNNVSNVNTVAFKAGRVTFKEGFAQLVESATPPGERHRRHEPDASRSRLADRQHRNDVHAGQSRDDGPEHRPRDSGQLVLRREEGQRTASTRAPATSRSTRTASLVAGVNGFAVQGRLADERQARRRRIGDLKIPFGQIAPATATTKVQLSGNLDASAAVFDKGSAATLDRARSGAARAAGERELVQGHVDHRLRFARHEARAEDGDVEDRPRTSGIGSSTRREWTSRPPASPKSPERIRSRSSRMDRSTRRPASSCRRSSSRRTAARRTSRSASTSARA